MTDIDTAAIRARYETDGIWPEHVYALVCALDAAREDLITGDISEHPDYLEALDMLDAARAANETCDEKRLEYLRRAEAAEARIAAAMACLKGVLFLAGQEPANVLAENVRRALDGGTDA